MCAQDILHNNILNNQTSAILAYDWPLRGFYKYAQQLEMESNGKQTDRNGEMVNYQTNPVIWAAMAQFLSTHFINKYSKAQKT